MFRILRKQRLTKVCSLEVTVFISFHVSDPYNNTDLTLLRMIRSLALVDILLFFHTVRKHHLLFEFIQYILCSTPIFSPHTVRYVKLSTSSIFSLLRLNRYFLCVFRAFVSFTFTTSPVFTGLFVKSSSFVCISPCVSDSRHKSRSSSLLTKPHWTPRHLSRFTFCITALISIKNLRLSLDQERCLYERHYTQCYTAEP